MHANILSFYLILYRFRFEQNDGSAMALIQIVFVLLYRFISVKIVWIFFSSISICQLHFFLIFFEL